MTLGDIVHYTDGPFGNTGTQRFTVQANPTGPQINPGEPVVASASGVVATVVGTMATNKPGMGTDWIVGIAQSVSTETTSANGVVDVYNDIFRPDVSFLISPNSTTTYNTQAKYNALVGSRVLLDKTAGKYTILSTDGANNGCVVLPLDVGKYPGKVRFAFRAGCNWLNGVAGPGLST